VVDAIRCLARTFCLALLLLAAVSDGAIAAAWQEEWQATVQAAKREGQLTVYISGYGANSRCRSFPERLS
jgi:hypothetical protein